MIDCKLITKRIDKCEDSALNYLVATCERGADSVIAIGRHTFINSTGERLNYLDPAQVCKIIDREHISVCKYRGFKGNMANGSDIESPFWIGAISSDYNPYDKGFWVEAASMIQAALRAYVANKLDSIEVTFPECLEQ